VDLLPYLLGKAKGAPHERLFWRQSGGASFGVREGRYKLVKMRDEKPALYDLQTDRRESRDLAGDKPEIAARLEKARVDWNRQLIAPLF
jgi:hypothetical protein